MKPILLLITVLFIINTVDAQWSIKHLNENSQNSGIIKFKNDSVGFFMGGNSNCLKTTDGGETWEEKLLNVNGEINFFDFQFVGDSSVFAMGVDYDTKVLSSGLIRSEDLGENWERISTFLQENLLSVWFFNKDSGLVSSYKGIYRTIDAGNSWDTVWSISQSGYEFGEVKKMFFPVPNVGYAIGYGLSKETDQFDQFLLKSNDTGKTWDTINTSMDSNIPPASYMGAGLLSVYFVNQDTGFVGTEGGYILKTTDGGDSWIETQISEGCEVRSVQFISETNGYAVGGMEWFYYTNQESNLTNATGSRYNFVISKTIDGGVTWLSYDTVGLSLSSVYFVSDTLGFVSGDFELIMKSNGNINQLPDDYPWHLNIKDGTDISEFKQLNKELNVYPNPVQEILTVQFNDPTKAVNSISLINAFGQILQYQNSLPNSQCVQLNVDDYSSGIYFVKVEYDARKEIVKVIKY